MNPEAHLLASWVIAAKTTTNPRDCRLVALAGILPDADGLGVVADLVGPVFGHRRTFFYPEYHHYLLHSLFGAVVITCLLTCFARQKWRVGLLSLGVFHLHLLCDLVGSRGPAPEDLWLFTTSARSAETRCGSGKASGGWMAGKTGCSRSAYSPGRFGCPCSSVIPS